MTDSITRVRCQEHGNKLVYITYPHVMDGTTLVHKFTEPDDGKIYISTHNYPDRIAFDVIKMRLNKWYHTDD